MEKNQRTTQPQPEIPYQTPENKPRPHPLAILSVSVSSILATIFISSLVAEYSSLHVPVWLSLKEFSIYCTCGAIAVFSVYLAMFALGAIRDRPQKYSGRTLAVISMLLATAELLLLLSLFAKTFFSFDRGL